MFVTTKLIIDLETGAVIGRDGFDYEGPVELCKGDPIAKAAEQQQLDFNKQLMSVFQTQFGKQSQVLDFLKGKMTPMIEKPTGLSAEALAATRTSSTDQFSQAYQNAQRALNAKMASSGESQLPSGVGAQLNEALLNAEAADKASAQNQITMQNEELKQSNYWGAVNALNGVAAQQNPLGYAGSATAGSGAVANLSQAVTAANGPGWGSILGGAVGSLGSAAIGAFCVTRDTLITLANQFKLLAAHMVGPSDKLEGLEGDEKVLGHESSTQECVRITLENGNSVEASKSHTFLLASGGYVMAENSEGKVLRTADGISRVISVSSIGQKSVVKIKLSNAHAYLTNGIWSLE